MTGFGNSHIETEKYIINVEIRSLNSTKGLDISSRISSLFLAREAEIKSMISNGLERGKIHITLSVTSKGAGLHKVKINTELAEAYFYELKKLADRVQTSSQDLLRIVMLMPDVVSKDQDSENTEEVEEIWKLTQQAIERAISLCNEFREQEGKILADKLLEYIQNIKHSLHKIEQQDPKRIMRVREKLQKQINDFIHHESFDATRFEQELIYYIEKLDISEEKVRLSNHLKYFADTIILPSEQSNGKKLGFIAQEIGREINTIGSKANDSDIQKWVIDMKEELEKIKEQSLNIL